MYSNNKNNDKWAEDMIEEIAEVKAVGQGFAEIMPKGSPSCSSCSSNNSCSSSSDVFTLFSGIFASAPKAHTIRVQNPVYAKPGDKVVVGVRPNTVLKGSILAYFVPLIMLVLFAALGDFLFAYLGLNAEVGSIVLGLFGLYAGFTMIARLLNNSVIAQDFEAVILRVIEPDIHPVSFSLSS